MARTKKWQLKKLDLAEIASRRLPIKGLSEAQCTYLFQCLKLSELHDVLKANLNRDELLPLGLADMPRFKMENDPATHRSRS